MVPKGSIGVIALAFLAVSCASTTTTLVWESIPPVQEAVNREFSLSLEPLRESQSYFSVFRITVDNKSDADMEIDWNKSRYIHNGRTVGGFVFRGIDPSALKDGAVPPDTVRAGSSFRKDIAPANLIAFRPLRDTTPGQSGFRGGVIPSGENSVLLVIRQNGREIPQQVSVLITEGSASGAVSQPQSAQSQLSR